MNRLAAVVAALTVARLVMAALVPLAPDETYYWIWSHALAPGYLDHPPMVALWIKAGTLLLGQIGLGQTALGVRLLGPLAAALASWFVYDSTRRLFPGRSAAAAVLLLNATLLLGVGTVIMTPDSPLLFFWTATLWAMVRLIDSGDTEIGDGRWWLAAGLFAGLAMDSKYTGLLLWVGIGLWALFVPAVRPWLKRWQPWPTAVGAHRPTPQEAPVGAPGGAPGGAPVGAPGGGLVGAPGQALWGVPWGAPWVAIVIGAAVFAPVIWWNAAHGWIGLLKQGDRVSDWRPMRAVGYEAELVGGQIGLATPWIWVLCMAGLTVAVRRCWTLREPRWSLLAGLSLPPVLVFVQHALGDRVQGNWPAIIYPALAIAAAGWLAPSRDGGWLGASALGFGITTIVYLQAALGLLPVPVRFDPIALQLNGWDAFAQEVEAERVAVAATYVVGDGYTLDSELAWWLPASVPVVGTDPRWRSFDLPKARIGGEVGLLVRDARRTDPPDPADWVTVERIGTIRRAAVKDAFGVYRVRAVRAPAVALALPRRAS